MKPFIFIYRSGNNDRVVVDITETNYKIEDVLNVYSGRATDYVLYNPSLDPVLSTCREYLKCRGWIYISNFSPRNIFEVAEIERICLYRKKEVQKEQEKKKYIESCTNDFIYY